MDSLSPSEINSLAASNDFPSQVQLQVVRSLQIEVSSKLSALETDKLKLSSSEYLKRRSKYRQLEKTYQHILAPFRAVPLDIILRIFTCCYISYMPHNIAAHFRNHSVFRWRYPLLLGQVCRSWRKFVAETPSLWSRLCVGFGKMPTDGEWKWLDMQVARSVIISNLHVVMSFDNTPDVLHDLRLSLVPKYIAPHTHRITTLHLYQVPLRILAGLRDRDYTFPILESLILTNNTSEDFDEASVRPIFAFEHATRLRKFRGFIAAVKFHARGISFPQLLVLPWKQLTFLELSNIQYANDYAIMGAHTSNALQLCTSLEKLVMSFSGFESFSTCTFSNMRKLTLNPKSKSLSSDADNPSLFNLDKLVVPYITDLEFARISYVAIHALIRASSCRLTSLTVSNVETDVEKFVLLLEQTPMLVHLKSEDSIELCEEIFAPLSEKIEEELRLVPNLESMVLRCYRSGPVRAADKAVADVVLARWGGGNTIYGSHSRKLKKFHLQEDKTIKGQPGIALMSCRDEGLDLKLSKFFGFRR